MSDSSVQKVGKDLKEWKPKEITNLIKQIMTYSILLDIQKKQCYHINSDVNNSKVMDKNYATHEFTEEGEKNN